MNFCKRSVANLDVANGRFDRTEVVVRLGDLLVDANLTESDFQRAPKEMVGAYLHFPFPEVFSSEELLQTTDDYGPYQLCGTCWRPTQAIVHFVCSQSYCVSHLIARWQR